LYPLRADLLDKVKLYLTLLFYNQEENKSKDHLVNREDFN